MQKREDSCDLYFWKVADAGECNYADYLVSRGIPIPAGWGVGQVTEGTAEEEDSWGGGKEGEAAFRDSVY